MLACFSQRELSEGPNHDGTGLEHRSRAAARWRPVAAIDRRVLGVLAKRPTRREHGGRWGRHGHGGRGSGVEAGSVMVRSLAKFSSARARQPL